FRGHAYCVHRKRPRLLSGDRFLLVGDAAGLARDFSGEGIGPAVRSACLAAETIESGDLARYGAAIEETFGRPSGLVGAVLGLLPARAVEAAGRLAGAPAWARGRVVLEGAFGMG